MSGGFPSWSLVEMADGRFKNIVDVQVGDAVRGRYGETNRVVGLERSQLGNRKMYRINGEHWTTDDLVHLTARGFTTLDVESYEDAHDYDAWKRVINGDGVTELWLDPGLPAGTVRAFGVGDRLWHKDGLRLVMGTRPGDPSIWTADFRLYNLVLDGSHAYRVDGYLVIAWPSLVDFDYGMWHPIDSPRVIEKRSFKEKMSWRKKLLSWLQKSVRTD